MRGVTELAQPTRRSKYACACVRISPLGTMPDTQVTRSPRPKPRAMDVNHLGSTQTSSSVNATIE